MSQLVPEFLFNLVEYQLFLSHLPLDGLEVLGQVLTGVLPISPLLHDRLVSFLQFLSHLSCIIVSSLKLFLESLCLLSGFVSLSAELPDFIHGLLTGLLVLFGEFLQLSGAVS